MGAFDGSSGPGTTTTLDGRQRKIESALASNILPNIGQGVPAYTGQQVAPLDQGYQNIYGQLQAYNPTAQNQQAQQGINAGLSGQASYTPNQQYGTLPTLNPQDTSNYFQQAVANPALAQYQQTTAPAIDAAFAGQGATFSSRRGLAQQQALQNMQTSLNSQLGQAQLANQQLQYQTQAANVQQQNQLGYSYNALNANLADSAAQRQQNAVGQSQQQSVLPLQQASALQSLYQPYQNQAQNQASAQYNEFLREQPYNSPYTQQAMSLLGANTIGLYANNQPSLIQDIQGGASTAGSLLGVGKAAYPAASSALAGLSSLFGGTAAAGGLAGASSATAGFTAEETGTAMAALLAGL